MHLKNLFFKNIVVQKQSAYIDFFHNASNFIKTGSKTILLTCEGF